MNSAKRGNIREHATISQLVVLANLETLNAEFIKKDQPQEDRLIRLNTIARYQMNSLIKSDRIKKLEKKI